MNPNAMRTCKYNDSRSFIDNLIFIHGKPDAVNTVKEGPFYGIKVVYGDQRILMVQASKFQRQVLMEYWKYKIDKLNE